MKIKKNLSDAEMFKGYVEQDSFETAVLQEKPVKQTVKQEKTPMISLPMEIIEKLDKEILRMRIEFKNRGINDIKWQLSTKNDEIILKAVPVKK